MNNWWKNKWCLLLVLSIAFISFFSFSTYYNPLANSDDALNVLMAHEYQLPRDFYCWGQDRGGTLIPFLSQPFVHWFNCSPLLAVSLSNYLVFSLGFIGFASLFKRNSTVILFAILWFLPFQRFVTINLFPIGMGYSLFGFSLLFLNQISFSKEAVRKIKIHLLCLTVLVIWLFAIWTSDLIWITLAVFFLSKLIRTFRTKTPGINYWIAALYAVAALVISIQVIGKLKSFATTTVEDFQTLNSLAEVITALQNVGRGVVLLMAHPAGDFFVSLGAWILFIAGITTLFLIFRNLKYILRFSNFWQSFFVAEFFVSMAVIFASHWVFLNQMGHWYFVAPYFSLSMVALFFADQLPVFEKKQTVIVASILFLTVSVSSYTKVMNMYDGKYMPARRVVGELDRLGEIGIIGSYWNSYKNSIVHPDKIIATPHDQNAVRSMTIVARVFRQPKLYLCKDLWMDEFPDTVVQFGLVLKKKGKQFYIAGGYFCEYERVKIRRLYTADSMAHPETALQLIDGKKVLVGSPGIDMKVPLAYGQDFSFAPGKYKIRYYVTTNNDSTPFAIDVSTDYGGQLLRNEQPKNSEIKNGVYEFLFTTEEVLRHCEIRLYYLGKGEVQLSGIEIYEL